MNVETGAQPLLLAVNADERTTWRFHIAPGADVRGVLALGREPPTVTGVPAGTTVLATSLEDPCEDVGEGPWPYSTGPKMQELILKIEAMVGRPVVDIQSAYRPRSFLVHVDRGLAPVSLPLQARSNLLDQLRSGRLTDAEIVTALRSRDPAIDAASAVASGELRLIFQWSPARPGAGHTQRIAGVVCQGSPRTGDEDGGLELTSLGGGPHQNSTTKVRTQPAEDAMLAYAKAYNRSVVSQPSYPYRDVCRPGEASFESWPAVPWAAWSKPLQTPGPALSLADAARQGDIRSMQRLLSKGAEIGQRDPFRLTPLGWAAVRGRAAAATWLIRHGADPVASGGQADKWLLPLYLAEFYHRDRIKRAMLSVLRTPSEKTDAARAVAAADAAPR